ncbi:MAG TPA: hypothetical protein VFI24_04115 [Pyrinomonadaceae bacterium]|nr:hypothetical protein [Pyrinomonadaceae bacterium]
MKLLKHSLKARVFWLLASFFALLISAPVPGLQAQKSRDESQSTSTWIQQDGGEKRRLEIRGKAEFSADYTDITSVSEGGRVIVEEVHRGQSRRYEVKRDGSGQITRTFYLNGTAHPLDENARVWIAKLVLDGVRQAGFDAEKRVKTILAQGGVAGVLAEINQIQGDYAKRIYYAQLLKQGNLNATAMRDVLRQAARDISSDYEQAQLLTAVAPMVAGKDVAVQPYFDAVATIESDYERGRVLKTLLKQETASSAMLVLVASSTKTISSDYERHGVLSALAKTKNQSEEVLRLLLDSATEMSSDYEKATLLVEVSNVYTGDARLKSAFLKAVETIKSDYERGRVLSVLLKNKHIG